MEKHQQVANTVQQVAAQNGQTTFMLEGMPWYLTPHPERPAQDFRSERFRLGSALLGAVGRVLTGNQHNTHYVHMVDDVHISRYTAETGPSFANALSSLEEIEGMTMTSHPAAKHYVAMESWYWKDGLALCSNLDAQFQLEKFWHLIAGGTDFSAIGFALVHPAEFKSQQSMMLNSLTELIHNGVDGFRDTFPNKSQIRNYLSQVYTHVWLDQDGTVEVTKPKFVEGKFIFEAVNL